MSHGEDQGKSMELTKIVVGPLPASAGEQPRLVHPPHAQAHKRGAEPRIDAEAHKCIGALDVFICGSMSYPLLWTCPQERVASDRARARAVQANKAGRGSTLQQCYSYKK